MDFPENSNHPVLLFRQFGDILSCVTARSRQVASEVFQASRDGYQSVHCALGLWHPAIISLICSAFLGFLTAKPPR
jgi:predicted GNAT superfamily acetyltransferase